VLTTNWIYLSGQRFFQHFDRLITFLLRVACCVLRVQGVVGSWVCEGEACEAVCDWQCGCGQNHSHPSLQTQLHWLVFFFCFIAQVRKCLSPLLPHRYLSRAVNPSDHKPTEKVTLDSVSLDGIDWLVQDFPGQVCFRKFIFNFYFFHLIDFMCLMCLARVLWFEFVVYGN